MSAGITGNALGKFLRSERGARHGLTPLTLGRLSPVIGVPEIELMMRSGHRSSEATPVSVPDAILRDRDILPDDKVIMRLLYERFTWDKKYPGWAQAETDQGMSSDG
jgi:hypothetical protein